MRIRNTLIGSVAASAAAIALGTTSAFASVNVDLTTGTGFIGQGAVQSALGYNNSALQQAVDSKSLAFTAKQPTSQSLSQDATQSGSQIASQVGLQSGTQSGTEAARQVVSQDLTCTFTNGNGTKTFHRDGVRDGERTGTRTVSHVGTREGSRDVSREGTRTGSRTGVLTGSLAYDLDVEARKANQYTGFIVNGWRGEPSYEAGETSWTSPVSFGDWQLGDWELGDWKFGDYTFGDWSFGAFEPVGDVQWGTWDAAPGENPDDCLRSDNSGKITDLSNVITPGTVIDGDITPGAITYDGIETGVTTTSGPAQLFVNGKAL
ncbi:hypothetical protein [Streptomyces brasiliensis]|uniref:Uncharacterized protein n=1 Tax=Streptomyces brasiliensis TaxID=1954 RepID=A0A917L8G0_9ACTN|nr:hypothetical protein [Streptomyces brasiliensis]GGJ52009.1 hypothetical protein GCM10010121_073650 [Streptomyces brasiliensis]